MTTAEKVAYLKGLAEGFGIDKETKVKILSVNGKAECPIGQNRMVIELE